MDEIYFTIETSRNNKKQSVDFKLSNDFGEIDGESYNPFTGWTGYTKFDQGWSEQDEVENELIRAIKEYSQSDELTDLILNVDMDDIGKSYDRNYFCHWFVDEDKEYNFQVQITDAEFGPN